MKTSSQHCITKYSRQPDLVGFEYWVDELNQTGFRGGMIVSFANSDEYIENTATVVDQYLDRISISDYLLVV